jgi:putative ABC transport system permease protein
MSATQATTVRRPGAGGRDQGRPGAGNWLGVVRTASGGVLRHKVQAVVIVAVLVVATASATLGLALLNANNSPFTKAFAAQHGADVTVTANPGKASAAQLAATAHAAGVTAMAGPFDVTTLSLEFAGQPWGQTTLVGRADPGGPVDDVVLNAGHWADGRGQVVLAGTPGPGGPGNDGPVLGSTFTAISLPGKPVLTVVGFANSITDTANGGGWVTPAELSTLQAPGSQPTAQLLYRFTNAATNAQLQADAEAVTKTLPSGTVLDWGSWLTAQQSKGSNAAIMEPFVIAFALIGLVMAVLIVSNVISGAVIAQYQRIGVLKSLGLTPAQVVAVYLSRIGWPALIGCVIGVIGGYALTIPVLQQSAGAYGVGSQQAPLWALVLAPAGMLAITVLAALGPALRAGRLSAVEAIASGRAPGTGRGYAVHRLAARLNVPRQPAAPGQPGPRCAVRQARPHPRHPRVDHVRGHRRDLRDRTPLLAEPGKGQPVPVGHRAGPDRAEQPGTRAERRAQRRAVRRRERCAEPARGGAQQRPVRGPRQGGRLRAGRPGRGVGRAKRLDGLRAHLWPLVRHARTD